MSLHVQATPPPSEKLRALVEGARPVTLRRPLHQLALLLACALAVGALAVLGASMRPDRVALSSLQLGAAAAMWAIALVGGAALVFVPEPQQVLPSLGRARLGLWGVAVLALVAGVALAPDSEASRHLVGMAAVHGAWHCARYGLFVAAPIFVLGWWLVVRRIPVGGAVVGAALGAATGALAGLVLVLVCSVGGAMHALCGHVVVVAVGAALGAVSAKR